MDFELKDCGGCRTCQIACSFKLTGQFNYNATAIDIIEKQDNTGYIVRIAEDGAYKCDGCNGHDEPMCIRYCHIDKDLNELINTFKKERLITVGKESSNE
ncbi:MAG: hypothetical protein WDA65_05570 [Christensenellales bacterium]